MPLIVIFILSLAGVYVLFGCFKSSGGIESNLDLGIVPQKGFLSKLKTPKIKISGAIAGFVIIFGLLCNLYHYLEATKTESWIISGTIDNCRSFGNEDILVSYSPPSPGVNVHRENGHFDLYNVKIYKDGKFPVLQFSCKGYLPEDYAINRENSEINKEERTIKLKNKIILDKY